MLNSPSGSLQSYLDTPDVAAHAVQFYETDAFLIDMLDAYVGAAFDTAGSAVIVATVEHRTALERRFTDRGFDLAGATRSAAYVSLDAAELVAALFANGILDRRLFVDRVGAAVARARGGLAVRPVRVFGEMVAILWSRGDGAGALSLEAAWTQLMREMRFALVCAYPISAFSQEDRVSGRFLEVVAAHEKGHDASPGDRPPRSFSPTSPRTR